MLREARRRSGREMTHAADVIEAKTVRNPAAFGYNARESEVTMPGTVRITVSGTRELVLAPWPPNRISRSALNKSAKATKRLRRQP
jgi:hypothetical protein